MIDNNKEHLEHSSAFKPVYHSTQNKMDVAYEISKCILYKQFLKIITYQFFTFTFRYQSAEN